MENNDYTIDYLRSLLNDNVVEVTFTKADGSTRLMKASTNVMYIPESTDKPKGASMKKREHNDSLVTVVDIDAGAWRSFRFDSLQSFTVIHDAPVLVKAS